MRCCPPPCSMLFFPITLRLAPQMRGSLRVVSGSALLDSLALIVALPSQKQKAGGLCTPAEFAFLSAFSRGTNPTGRHSKA